MLKKEHEARLQITQDMQSRTVGTCVGQVGNSPLILASVEAKPKTSKILGLLLARQGFQTFLRTCKGLELYLDRPFPLGLSDGCTYIAYPTTCTCCLQAKVLWNRINPKPRDFFTVWFSVWAIKGYRIGHWFGFIWKFNLVLMTYLITFLISKHPALSLKFDTLHPVWKWKWKAENRASSNSSSQGF